MSLRASIALVSALGCLGGGCGDDGPLVPFKLQDKGTGAGTTTGGPAPEAEPAEGVAYPELTERITVQGHTLSVKGHAFRAALEADLNQDQRRDVLLVLQNERGAPVLASALADAEGLGTVEPKGALLGEGESCVVESLALSRLSATFVLLRMRAACGEPAELPPSAAVRQAPPAPPEPGEPSPASPGHDAPAEPPAAKAPRPVDVLIRIDGEPSVVERLVIDADAPASELPAAEPRASVSAAWSAGDVDADGHIDLTLQLTTKVPGQDAVTLAVRLLDRPSGLARDTSEVEKVWLTLADESKLARRGQPDRAYALATRVVASHAAICRESGEAAIELSGERGIPCGASLAVGRAATIEAAVLARRGKLLRAIAIAREVQRSAVYSLTDNDRERVRYALDERTKPVAWRHGPAVTLGAAPAVRRSAIAFLDESRLLSRGVQGALAHDLTSGAEEPASAALAALVIQDPAGKRALTALATRCDGVHGSVVAATQVVAGLVTGAPIAEPLLWPSGLGADACEKEHVVFDDAPELQVLGWTRAGVVLAADGALYAVAIDDASRARAPEPLAASRAEALSELGPSAVSPAGIALVPTSAGLVRVGPDGKTALFGWPAGLARAAVNDVAVSPAGRHLAVLAGGRVHLADADAAPPAPAPPSPPAPPAPPEPAHAP